MRHFPSDLTENAALTVDWEPGENRASGEPPPDLVDPYIVEGHPSGPIPGRKLTWFDAIPETGGFELLVTPDGVPRPLAACGKHPGTGGLTEDRSGWRGPGVLVPTPEEDERTQQEQEGWKRVGQPETDVLKPK